MPLELTPGVEVTIEPPAVPTVTVVPPPAATVTVLPIAGPPGPQGPPGAAGVSTNASYMWQQQNSTYLVQIMHNLGFYPAGVTAIDTAGDNVEYAGVAYPTIDIVEVSFDVLFTGTIYLS